MSVYYDIIDAAVHQTGRFDIQDAQWPTLIGQVVAQISRSGKYWEDYWETNLVVDYPAAVGVAYLVDPDSGAAQNMGTIELVIASDQAGNSVQLRPVMPRDLLESGRCGSINTYYMAAPGKLNYAADLEVSNVLVGWYRAPPSGQELATTWGGLVGNRSANDYWITTLHRDLVIAGVSAAIFRQVGELDTFAMYEAEFQRLLMYFRNSRADGGGR